MQADIVRIQRLAQELRRKAVELDEELSALRDQIDAMGSNPPADVIQGGFGTVLPEEVPAPISEPTCEPKLEGDDAA